METDNREKKVKRARAGMPLLVVFALILGLVMGYRLPTLTHVGKSSAGDKVAELMALIERHYVEEVDVDSLLEESIPDILAKLDPHTAYIPAKDLNDVNSELEGSFSGIGIQFQVMNDTITVLEVIAGGPADDVGLLPGDRIVEVDDSLMVGPGLNSNDVVRTLRGPADSQVKVDVKRAGAPGLLSFTLTRGDIPVTSIDASYLIAPETGYIKLNTFGRNSYSEFYTQLAMLRSVGARDFILDLRGNGGGFLDIAIQIANEFLPAGAGIVETRGRNGESISGIAADGSGSLQQGELIVLLDEFSASASEIVAGAVQDNDRGTIIGRRSFGKGLVQTQEDLSDGSALRITTARYYTPSGRCIQKPFRPGHVTDYALEVYDRYASGEAFSADSVKFDTSLLYHTASGREVYGGGGIMPDIFVPADTANVTKYYSDVVNRGLLQRFAFKYVDANRATLDKAGTADELLTMLPADQALLGEFVAFAAENGVAARWYYINISRPLLVNALKALIARDVLGTAAYFEIDNTIDNVVGRALSELQARRNGSDEQ